MANVNGETDTGWWYPGAMTKTVMKTAGRAVNQVVVQAVDQARRPAKKGRTKTHPASGTGDLYRLHSPG